MADQEGPLGPAELAKVAKRSACKGEKEEAGGSGGTEESTRAGGSEGTDDTDVEGGSEGTGDSDVERSSGGTGESAREAGSEGTGDSDVEGGSGGTGESAREVGSEGTVDSDVEGGSGGTGESAREVGSEGTVDSDVEGGSGGTGESAREWCSGSTDESARAGGSEGTGNSPFFRQTILTPTTIQSQNLSFTIKFIVYERSYEKNLIITMSTNSQTSNSMKILLTKIHELCCIEQWKIFFIAEWGYPDFKVLTTRKHQYIDIATLPLKTLLAIQRYVDWLRHRRLPQLSVAGEPLTDARRFKIVSQVDLIFYLNEMAMALIVAGIEKKTGHIDIDQNLKDETLIELEWFCDNFGEELRANLALGRRHCLC